MTQPLQTQMVICGECGSVRGVVPAILVNRSKLSLQGQEIRPCPVCELQARVTALNLELNAALSKLNEEVAVHEFHSAEAAHGVLV